MVIKSEQSKKLLVRVGFVRPYLETDTYGLRIITIWLGAFCYLAVYSMLIPKNSWGIIVLLILIIIFYWFQVRPSHIKKVCLMKVDDKYSKPINFADKEIKGAYQACLVKYGI